MIERTSEAALRLPDLLRRVGMSRSWVYEQIAAGRFPKPVKIGVRSSVWLESEIAELLTDRIRQRDAGPTPDRSEAQGRRATR
jgi:prophage regulatory protein